MDNDLRLQYLEAMGIDVWLTRTSTHSEPSLLSEVVNDSAEPETAALADRWDALQAEVANCTKCALCTTRTQTVFGSGNKQADWMLIGEAPGQHEDERGLPFVGNAGLLLTEMLRAIGLNREEVFITNILKCRPPNNRDPRADEAESCNVYLQRQQKLIQPKIILAIGRIAAQTLLKTDEPLSRLRGKIHTFNNTPVVVVYHPAYLLRSLTEKRKAWQDLIYAVQIMKENKG
ncbi:MAG: uracil-DNA glycosylase [Methylococcales bacterium]|nr:uracil-DNA glycosylase [Methylococcales bacterium]